MPDCNPAFRADKKLDVNKIRALVFFITSRPAATIDRVQATPAHEIEQAGLSQADADVHGAPPPGRGVQLPRLG